MGRRRRTPTEAREHILNVAEALVVEEGPDALRVARVAEMAGVSHPTVLHHFGSVANLLSSLHHRVARHVRDELVMALEGQDDTGDRLDAIGQTLARISDPRMGRLIAWLVASGREPFPPEEEQGLATVVDRIVGDDPLAREALTPVVLLIVLACYGDAMVGDAVRRRLGVPGGQEGRDALQAWVVQQIRNLS